jgi:uncharacterized protein (DUF488 family)
MNSEQQPSHNSESEKTLTLYTIGHSNLSADDFLTYLRRHDITVLVDVRSAPYSRFVPHFNKAELEVFLKTHHIDYRFAGEYLGGQPKHADVYKDGQIPGEDTERPEFLGLVQYEEVMKRDWYQKGIQRLLQIIQETMDKSSHVAVMCSEGNPRECHRHHLIARSLIDPSVRIVNESIKVQHIIKDGNIQPVKEEDFILNNIKQPNLF